MLSLNTSSQAVLKIIFKLNNIFTAINIWVAYWYIYNELSAFTLLRFTSDSAF
jgi:hypothetical protein